MSALEKLIAEYQRDLYKPEREHLRRAELEAMQMYNEIAHELAEKIRKDTTVMACPGELEALGYADLIDPEVE